MFKISGRSLKDEESFAELWLEDRSVKVEIVERYETLEGYCLVRRVEGIGQHFESKVSKPARLGLMNQRASGKPRYH